MGGSHDIHLHKKMIYIDIQAIHDSAFPFSSHLFPPFSSSSSSCPIEREVTGYLHD